MSQERFLMPAGEFSALCLRVASYLVGAVLIIKGDIAVRKIGILFYGCVIQFQAEIGLNPVITVHERNIISACRRYSRIAGCTRSLVRAVIGKNDIHVRVVSGKSAGPVNAVIMAMVINQHDLQVCVGLAAQRLKAADNVISCVLNRYVD